MVRTTHEIDEDSSSAILVVDDQVQILKTMEKMFSKFSVPYYSLSDPKLVINFLKEHPHITKVLLDLNMPGLNGMELNELIQQHLPNRELNVKFMSGFSKDELQEKLGLAPDDIITKPFGLREIRNLIGEDETTSIRAETPTERQERLNRIKRRSHYNNQKSLEDFF